VAITLLADGHAGSGPSLGPCFSDCEACDGPNLLDRFEFILHHQTWGIGIFVSKSVAAPIFTAATADGRKSYSLFGLFATVARGELIDLPGMAAHQRAPVVTVLAILMHVLARYAKVDRASESSWARAWDELIGPDALRIIAPYNEVAFLQPPTNEPTSRQSIEAADLLLPNVEHEVKRTWVTARADEAIFSLIGSLSRPNVKDHRSSTRTGLCAVLPSVDGTLGSEISRLLSAYDQMMFPTGRSTKASDHFVWLKPYRPKAEAPISFADLPRPFLDIGRAQRVDQTENSRFEIWACPNNAIRVTGTDPWLDDPHTPRITNEEGTKRYKLAAKAFDHRFQHQVLFGVVDKRDTIDRPRILDLVDYRYVRLCALGTEQGKTKGYRDALFVAARSEGLFHLDPPKPEDRPARLSASALATIDTGRKVLYSALASLYPDTDDVSETDQSRIRAAQRNYYDAVGHASVQLVFDLLNDSENAPEEQRRFDSLVATEVRQSFNLAATAFIRPLHVARAERRLEAGIHFRLKGEAMSNEFNPPSIARQAFAILRELSEQATPDNRAQLRTMFLPQPPLSFWKMMAAVPRGQTDDDRCVAIWKIVLRAFGDIYQSGKSLGQILATEEYPEARMDRLLTASGASLPGLIDEALRWLVSHQVKAADLSVLVTLGVADALSDAEARDWARKKIALDFVRSAKPTEHAGKSSKAVPHVQEAS
jgi:hypothetical protein